MRVFLDTEFSNENLLKAELVSLALASEDGRECYLERDELPLACCHAVIHSRCPPMSIDEAKALISAAERH